VDVGEEMDVLPFVEELDVVTLAPELFGNGSVGNGSAPMVAGVYGEKAMLKVHIQPGATPSQNADDPTTLLVRSCLSKSAWG
jgi:hypothetical protein